MERLNIYLLGEPRVYFDQCPVFRFPTQKTLELMALTALSVGDRISRERIASTLRDDIADTQSRKALSTDLWRLRQLFADAGIDSTTYLYADRNALGFREDAPIYLDVAAFEDVADTALRAGIEGLSVETAAALNDALTLYRDDFLPGLDREWCLILREKLRAKYATCLDLLLSYELKSDAWPRALFWAERIVELDPLLEHGHRAIMQCQFIMGNRGAAIRQYGECAALLRRELDIEPAEETQRMYRGLLSVQTQNNPNENVASNPALQNRPPGTTGNLEPHHSLTDQLALALGNLNTARRFIENVDNKLRLGETS